MRDEDKTRGQLISELQALRRSTERERVQEALRVGEERLRRIVASNADGIVVVGQDGKVRFVNPAVNKLLGRAALELVGQPFGLPLVHGESTEIEVWPPGDAHRNRHKTVEMRVVETTWEGEMAYLASLRDVTERKRIEEALTWEAEVNAAMAELSRALVTSASMEEISVLVLEQAKRLTGSAYGFVGYIDPQTGHLFCPTMTHDIWDVCQVADKTFVFEAFSGLWGWVLENGRPMLTNNPSDDPRSSGTPAGHVPVQRFLSAPAFLGEELVGQVALANPHRDYTERDLALVERLASLYAIAIERRRAEEALRQSQANLSGLINNTRDLIWSVDENLCLITMNAAFKESVEALLGVVPQLNQRTMEYLPPEMAQDWLTLYQRALQGEQFAVERHYEIGALKPVDVDISFNPIVGDDGQVKGVGVFGRDVTVRKQTEAQIKTALAEKEVLLKEVHHRVKNNLQVLIHLIDMQAETIQYPAVLSALEELQGRIRAMALIHERLYQSEDLAQIDLGFYLQDLTAHLIHTWAKDRPIGLQLDVADALINVNIAIPCGLIVNELVTNALKYAFPPDKEDARPRIRVEFEVQGDDYKLIVGDNGVGIPTELDWRATDSLGLKLVNLWATYQLGGSIELDNRDGTTFTVRFSER